MILRQRPQYSIDTQMRTGRQQRIIVQRIRIDAVPNAAGVTSLLDRRQRHGRIQCVERVVAVVFAFDRVDDLLRKPKIYTVCGKGGQNI